MTDEKDPLTELEEDERMPEFLPRKKKKEPDFKAPSPEEEKGTSSVKKIKFSKRKNRVQKIILILLSLFAVAAIAAVILWFSYVSPMKRYEEAERLLEGQHYTEARKAFLSLGSFKDSEIKAKESLYRQGKALQKEKKFDEANAIFGQIHDYKDSADLIHKCRWIVIDEEKSTCEKAGHVKSLCQGCGKERLEKSEKKSHDYTDATCTEAKTCKFCGSTEGAPLGHRFSENICSLCGMQNFEPLTFSGRGKTTLTNIDLPQGSFIIQGSASLEKGYADSFYLYVKNEDGSMITYWTESLFDTRPTAERAAFLQGPLQKGILEIEASDRVLWTITIKPGS